ncbi:MAG: NFACT family protein [Longimicrobiales bacterium]|nr:NFACT family protein [Longimicrobiales bacterium]
MSKPITYDSLLVHYLARELESRLSARRLRKVRLDSEHRRFTLELDDERLVWELHPTRGWLRVIKENDTDAVPVEAAEGFGGRTVRTQRRPRVRRVSAPPDDRILELEIDAGGPDRASRFVVELMTNQWNVLALAPDGRIVSALWSREAGGRTLQTGERYEPPGGFEPREGRDEPVALERWQDLLGAVDPEDRARALVRSLAWTSPLNAGAILEGGQSNPDAPGDGSSLEPAWLRYRELASRPDPHPQLLSLRGGTPYPLPLPGVDGRPVMSLLAAFEQAVETDPLAPEVREALEERLERVTRRAERLRDEAEKAPAQAERLRGRADLLMARLHQLEKGVETVELDGFEGETVTLELDPSKTPVENAEELYDRAKRRERAARQLPARVREAVAERNRIETLLDALDDDDADPEELARWIEELRPESGDGDDGTRLPYRRFRSSGGLEIRVGRSGRANDELTFHHSSPDDIWLHARDAAGAHVILRWNDRDQNPPRRDLLEAAVLAAVHSKARTSGSVPVDWTRRKYVRSPRKAPPGTVIPDRVSTVFVEPDEDVLGRLSD